MHTNPQPTRRLFLALAAFTGCNASSASPFSVVNDALSAANRKQYERAASFMVESFRSFGRTITRKDFATPAFWDQYTQRRVIARIEHIKTETSTSGEASVTTVIHYTDGKQLQAQFLVQREGSQWRLTPLIFTSKNWR